MNNSLISIIIPTYNRAHLISETLDSIVVQTYTNWECIVVDDGSTDGTDILMDDYVKKDSRFQFHHRPINSPKGANTCRNYGFELSKGEYINWFDSDDVMLDFFLKIKTAEFTPKLDLVICSGFYVDAVLGNQIKMSMDSDFDLFNDFILWKQHIITNSVLFRKSFLKDKELFSHRIKRGQETELFSRLFFKLPKESYRILNTPLFLYRQHLNSKTSKSKNYIKEYKVSESFITIQNLKRSFELKDNELIRNNYKNSVDIFFRGIDNSHYKNSIYVLINLILILYKKNIVLVLELLFFCSLFLLINRGSYITEQHFRKYEVKF